MPAIILTAAWQTIPAGTFAVQAENGELFIGATATAPIVSGLSLINNKIEFIPDSAPAVKQVRGNGVLNYLVK